MGVTDREKAIVMAYTGYAMLTGDKLGLFYQYVQEKVGRPVMTHELAEKPMQETIHTLSKPDFVELCRTNDKPLVMTLEEVKQHNNQDGCVWFEQPTYNAVAAFVRKDDEDYTEIISPYLLGEPINHGYMANRFYGKAWRCWTSRPDEKRRTETPWD